VGRNHYLKGAVQPRGGLRTKDVAVRKRKAVRAIRARTMRHLVSRTGTKLAANVLAEGQRAESRQVV
jgi:hypothetical protein